MIKNEPLHLEPSVAVALAVYNGAQWLSQQLDSIINQKDVRVTIFISIDPSTDDSENICKYYSTKYQNIILLPTIGKFGNAAQNFFRLIRDINLNPYDYLSLADQDDIWELNKIIRAVRCLKDSGYDGYSSNLKAFDSKKNKQWLVKKNTKINDYDYLFQGASAGCTYVLTQKAAKIIQNSLSGNRNNLMKGPSHDWTFYAICRSNNLGWYFDDLALINYRQHDNNFYGDEEGLKRIIKRLTIIKSGWYKNHILFLENVVTNTPVEMAIFTALKRNNFFDRIWLFLNCYKFRREIKNRIFLSILLLFGLI